jgi:GTPase SAR1 family protein
VLHGQSTKMIRSVRPLLVQQWISEVLHFCNGLPIILVGCKKDLRYDQRTIQELSKTSQKPVTEQEVGPLRRALTQRVIPRCQR